MAWRIILRSLLLLFAVLCGEQAFATPAPSITVGIPADFADLAQDHRIVADFFFGGRRIGQFEVDKAPGNVRIVHPDLVVAAIAGALDPAKLIAALSGPLDPHARLVCTDPNIPCERPTPDTAAIVFDDAHFRVDLYIAPTLLAVRPVTTDRFLKPTARQHSIVDTVGGAISGGGGQPLLYDMRNRIVVGTGAARFLSEASIGSGRNANVDTAAIQLDRPNLRYTAGLFYTPGADLVGRRRLIGAGITSQFDTRVDRKLLAGAPLVVFLTQRSRVDLLVEKRLISSHVYDAGNQSLDTSSLPDGSYPVEIRIQENGGATRTEQRFFTKSGAIPPAGRTIFFANAGLLAVDRPGHAVGVAGIPLGIAGVARRLGSHLAWDATVMATQRRALAEIGLTAMSSAFQSRVALLGSSRGDYGVLAQITSQNSGRLSYSFDLRRVYSRDNRPLIPLDDYSTNPLLAEDMQTRQSQRIGTTFSQIAAVVSYHIGQAQIGMSGYLRRDVGQATSYTFGPIVHWPILQRARFQLTFDGTYAQTNRGRSTAFGLRFQLFGKRASLGGTVGGQTRSLGDRPGVGELVEVSGSMQRDSARLGQITAAANLQHSGDGTIEQVSIDNRGSLGFASANLLHRSSGGQSGVQYGMSFQTTVAAARNGIHIGAQRQTDSAILVSLDGVDRNARFEVLVDDNPSGVVRPGGKLLVSVNPYYRYSVRLRPIGTGLVSFDATPRTVDVYPGTVATLHWKADPAMAMFGRIVRPDGMPIANADILATDAISASDDHGYFQIQTARDATLQVRLADGTSCHAILAAPASDKAYTALGDVTCRP